MSLLVTLIPISSSHHITSFNATIIIAILVIIVVVPWERSMMNITCASLIKCTVAANQVRNGVKTEKELVIS